MPTETVAWVREQAARLPRVPSLAMVHIPPPQFLTAWNRGPANGSRAEPVGCPGVDSGLFEALRCAVNAAVLALARLPSAALMLTLQALLLRVK